MRQMLHFLTHFKWYTQIHLAVKKDLASFSLLVIRSFITRFHFDTFEWKVEKFGAFLKKEQQKKLDFWVSTSDSEMNFHHVVNRIMRKKCLNPILWHGKTFVYTSLMLFHIFLVFKLRQRMEFHFKVHLYLVSTQASGPKKRCISARKYSFDLFLFSCESCDPRIYTETIFKWCARMRALQNFIKIWKFLFSNIENIQFWEQKAEWKN